MAAGAKQPTGRYGGRTAGERRAERRQRLLDAGLHLFGGGPGYRATSVSALCEEAGLSTRQFYEEFSNLEEVLAALHPFINKWAEEAAMSALATMPEGGVEERAAPRSVRTRAARPATRGGSGSPSSRWSASARSSKRSGWRAAGGGPR